MDDLFDAISNFDRIPMDEADVSYLPKVELLRPYEWYLNHFLEITPWRREAVTVWGKTYEQPRLIAWYGDNRKNYRYSGIDLTPLPWSAELLEIKKSVEERVDYRFNSVLLNLYRNQNDSMGMHADNEPELGQKPVIASLSLGAERALIFKHKKRNSTVKLSLKSGSLLLMKGETQKNWKHGINKTSKICGPRINFTFRNIVV